MKIGFLITARLKSSRLPFKILKDLNGKTVIERIIDRAKKIQNISEIILCTSTNSQDRPLVDIAKKIGTFETSIIPEEDCCTVFLPKKPVTKPKLEKIMLSEQNLDVEKLIDEAIENMEVVDITL